MSERGVFIDAMLDEATHPSGRYQLAQLGLIELHRFETYDHAKDFLLSDNPQESQQTINLLEQQGWKYMGPLTQEDAWDIASRIEREATLRSREQVEQLKNYSTD